MDNDVIDFLLKLTRETPFTVTGTTVFQVADLVMRAEEQLEQHRPVDEPF